jgi:hypothetical protein
MGGNPKFAARLRQAGPYGPGQTRWLGQSAGLLARRLTHQPGAAASARIWSQRYAGPKTVGVAYQNKQVKSH